jgi:hypothetical protein
MLVFRIIGASGDSTTGSSGAWRTSLSKPISPSKDRRWAGHSFASEQAAKIPRRAAWATVHAFQCESSAARDCRNDPAETSAMFTACVVFSTSNRISRAAASADEKAT